TGLPATNSHRPTAFISSMESIGTRWPTQPASSCEGHTHPRWPRQQGTVSHQARLLREGRRRVSSSARLHAAFFPLGSTAHSLPLLARLPRQMNQGGPNSTLPIPPLRGDLCRMPCRRETRLSQITFGLILLALVSTAIAQETNEVDLLNKQVN